MRDGRRRERKDASKRVNDQHATRRAGVANCVHDVPLDLRHYILQLTRLHSTSKMPSRKVRTADPSATKPPTHVPSESAEPFFPFARYTGIVGVHTSLLAFTAIFLPTTSPSSLLVQWGTQNPGSDDKPKRNFLQALTENPLRSVAWICAGALILQSWWASWVRSWQDESRRRKTDGAEEMQRRLERNEWKKQRIQVRSLQLSPLLLVAFCSTSSITLVQVFTQAATMTLAASVLFYVVAILFGAPLLRCAGLLATTERYNVHTVPGPTVIRYRRTRYRFFSPS